MLCESHKTLCVETGSVTSLEHGTHAHTCQQIVSESVDKILNPKGGIATISRQESKGLGVTETEHFPSQTSDITKASDA